MDSDLLGGQIFFRVLHYEITFGIIMIVNIFNNLTIKYSYELVSIYALI